MTLVFRLTSDAVYIGVHIRRSDMASDPKYTVADVGYFRRAVHFMTQKFPGCRLVFVVCTDDLAWSLNNFPNAVIREIQHHNDNINPSDEKNVTTANITSAVVAFSEHHRPEEDLAILSSCNHTIMTVGTFGWWAGYLAGGVTIYYRNFPSRDYQLFYEFSREDHFPSHWVGL